jgi:hypothetical protein
MSRVYNALCVCVMVHRTSPRVCSALSAGRGRARLRAHKHPVIIPGPAGTQALYAQIVHWPMARRIPTVVRGGRAKTRTCSGLAAHTARPRVADRRQPPLLQRPLPVHGGRGDADILCIQTGDHALLTAARVVCGHVTRAAWLLLLRLRSLPVPWCWERRGIGGCCAIRRVYA